MPTGEQLTMPRAPAAASSRLAVAVASVSGRASLSAAARRSARARSRSTSRIASAPRAARPNATALPTPPAPTWQTVPGLAGSNRARHAVTKPVWSVLNPRGPSDVNTTVLTAPIARTSGSSIRTRAAARSL